MVTAIVFDCFGVILTDALSDIIAALEDNDPEKSARIKRLVQAASKGAIDATASRRAVAAELGLTLEDYSNTIRTNEKRNEPLLCYILELKNRYKTALLSNVISGGLEARFPHNELSEYFDIVIASGDVGWAKPEAQAYGLTANRLGVQLSECIMIDDRQEYCDGAIAVGMQAILFQSIEQLEDELTLRGVTA
jgi:HAD superfamily hydrolase (TIGR01509 family)